MVTLYQGGEYWLYRYKKYTDVRLVFAPEQQAAFFGGDPDNFTFPRYDLDMALFRVYENGKPIESKDYLKWNPKGAADEELVFVSGNPGTTQRLDTMAQLIFERDIDLPARLRIYRRRIAVLKDYSARGAEQEREAGSRIFNFENSVKASEGDYTGLKDPAVTGVKQKEEDEFRAKVMANPQWKAAWGGAWDAVAGAEKKAASRIKDQDFHGLDSELANLATSIVQYVAEVKKPDGERLPGFHDAELDSLKFRLFSPAPIYPQMEIARMTGALQLDIDEVGKDDPFVKTVLNGKSPAQVAAALVNGTKLADPAVRKKLIEGGEAAVQASTDPMIVLARNLDPMRRELIKWLQDNVESVEQRAGEQLGKARFAVYGKTTYPDATFTLRLSYGQVKGYPMNGTKAPSKTTFYGLYDRAYSFDLKPPFNLPARYAEGRGKLDLATPLDFATTNDVVGGNSGSPVINRQAEIVGLIFDGNIESLVGDYVYNGENNRSIAVHTAGMTEALKKLYKADALLGELGVEVASVEEVSPVERVALLGDEARVADHAPQLFFGGLVVGARCRDDVLFDHDAANIVAAEAQSELADLQARGNPGTLDVLDVIEIDARDRQRFQVLDRGRFFFDEAAKRGEFALERPGDEGRESAGVFLNLPHDIEVVHALFDRLAAAEHHGGRGSHAQANARCGARRSTHRCRTSDG